MFIHYRYLNLYSFIFAITILSSTALFCSNSTSNIDKDKACFLESHTNNPVYLRSSGSSLVLPCHVARSKRSSVEWWYTDPQKSLTFKIYPVFPQVRPTVLRFLTSLTQNSTDTDTTDASILLRHVNVDDSGTYRCVIRSGITDPLEQDDDYFLNVDENIQTLDYQVQLTGPRLCQSSPSALPCFSLMRTTSPTIIDAYQTAFLQCVVKAQNNPINVFWVVGDESINSVLITNYLKKNQYNGDHLRRVFPQSLNDYSIEVSINHTIHQRTYSCVIDGATDMETTLFTYIVRNLEHVHHKVLNRTHHGEKNTTDIHSKHNQVVLLDTAVEDTDNSSEEDITASNIVEETTTIILS